MPSRKIAVAFAGTGPSTFENTQALLNDFFGASLPDGEGLFDLPDDLDLHILLPASDTHISESLITVFDWSDNGDLGYDLFVAKDADHKGRDIKALIKYARRVGEVTNVNSALIDGLKEDEANGYEPLLFLFWGEEGDENAEVLLDLASSAGIKAKDITAGLDDLSFDDPDAEQQEEAPEPEPEPEPEPRRRRGRARQALEEESTPLEDKPLEGQEAVPDGTEQSLDTTVNLSMQTAQKDTDDVPDPFTAISNASEDFMNILDGLLAEGREKSLALTNAEQAMFWAHAAAGRSGAPAAPETPADPGTGEGTQEPSRGRGRPRKDGQPTRTRTAEERASTEIWDEDEEAWVPKGRGRVPKGSKTRLVDPKTREVIGE